MRVVVINRHIIARNRKQGTCEAPIRVSKGRNGAPSYCSEVEFNGRGRLIYDPAHPLKCGATAWLEIEGEE